MSPFPVAVGIATVGRRDELSETLRELANQTRLPDRVIVCPGSDDDIDPSIRARLPYPLTVVRAPSVGLPAQRNAILDELADSDGLLVFFDDDFFPATDYLALAARRFIAQPDIVVATGSLLADGIHGPGIDAATARALLARETSALADSGHRRNDRLDDIYNAYGCNMCVRLAPVRARRLRFDENLPLYAWQEDLDFSRRLAPLGRIVRDRQLSGVHLAIKRGRNSGVRFGYSQIANPIYLIRKRTMHPKVGARLMIKNLISNVVRSAVPEPWIDRRGRLKGNLLAVTDALRGRMHPQRILTLR